MEKSNVPGSFQEWVQTLPQVIKDSPVWPSVMYQKSLFLHELCWIDCENWMHDARGKAIVEQITRSCGSISANIEEGFGRGFGKEYARFLTIAVASARETQGWYFRVRHLTKAEVTEHRMRLCDEIIAMLVAAIKDQRRRLKAASKDRE